MSEQKIRRQYDTEFRVQIAERMLAGENVVALSKQYKLPRSIMYRWREAYRKHGPDGLARSPGQPGRSAPAVVCKVTPEEFLRQRVAELERMLGQQAAEIDFFRGVFKRLGELPGSRRRGGTASTRRSSE